MFKAVFLVFILFFFLFPDAITAQTTKISLLKSAYNDAATATKKIDAALSICEQSYSLDNDELYRYASFAKKTAEDLKDKDREAMADAYIENYLIRKNLFDSALNLCSKDLKSISYQNNKEAYAKMMMGKCYCLCKANRHRIALDCSYNFLAEAEKYNDTLSQIYAKTIIGIVYRNMEQRELAMAWFEKADATSSSQSYEQAKNEFGVYFLLGMMYNWRWDFASSPQERLQDSLKAIEFIDRAINDSRKYEELNILAKSLNVKAATIGNKEHVEEEGNYVKEASHIYAQLNDTASMLNTISPMCFYYIDEGHPEKGVQLCKDGIKIASRNNSFPKTDLYDALSQCYYAVGDYKNYSDVLSTIIRIKDSLYKANSEQDLSELNARYEYQKKENIIIQQKLDLTSKKYSILLISIITGILLISIFFLYNYYRRKQKMISKQSSAAIVTAREVERKRISADLHDNIGAYAAAAVSSIGSIDTKNEQSAQQLGLLKNNIQEMIQQLNDSIWALNKKEVMLTGISDRFKVFVQKLERAYPHITISVHEKISKDHLLTSFQALHLFRMMQEALNNALRHSKCSSVNINIEGDASMICISITDDGKGMPTEKSTGNGINNLKMRAHELGWNATWKNNDSGGTQLVIDSGPLQPTANSPLAG